MQLMATIKDGVVLRVAASELSGRLDIMKASDNLTFLAEVIIQQAIDVARAELVSRHGVPGGENPGFAVMGYGKLGGIELGYGSDLDLVFVYSGAEGETSGPRQIDNARFFARLAQRVVHILGTNVASGQLYEVDMRLRPNGQSGLPCVNLEGFLRYQAESAWTWEHQALVRARPVAGDPGLGQALKEARRSVLCQPRDAQQLLADVVSMRRKMWTEGETQLADRPGQFDIKRAPGGIIDIEFMVQYLVLREAPHHSSLPEDTDVVNLLGSLATHGILTTAQGETLRVAYLDYRAHVHRAVLEGVEPLGHVEEFQETLTTVIEIRNAILPGLSGSPERAGGNIEEK
jgi:glutamate-ammonia-ligase adenylyltransferase